jgi:glycosyltransferase involved in cell wall biosynthesis
MPIDPTYTRSIRGQRNPIHIIEIIAGADVNGATQHGLLLSRELAWRGHAVTVVCRPNAWIRRELASVPVEVVESDLHRWPVDELWRVAGVARQKRIEVLHTHSSRAHLFGVLLRWLSGVPCVATAHAETRHWHWMLNDRVLAVSEATCRFLRTNTFVSRSRLEVIPNFVCPLRFAPMPLETRARVRASFGLDPSTPLIGFVGSLYQGKGWHDLVRVFSGVRSAEPRTRLLVVGDGAADYRAALEREATRLGVAPQIIWAGPRLDIPQVLAALDVFVSPSLQETFGLAVLEAMAAGLPVVAVAVGGLPELVCNGETGFLVPLGDNEAMLRAIIMLIRDEPRRRRLGETGQRRAREHFSPEIQMPRIEAAFARTIRSRRWRSKAL